MLGSLVVGLAVRGGMPTATLSTATERTATGRTATPSTATVSTATVPLATVAYAVVANPVVPVADVPLAQLREMFLGARATWSDGTRVVLIVQAPGSRSRAVVLRTLYRMDEAAFKRYWIARTFGAGAGAGPTLVASDSLALRLTARIPGAVAVVPAALAGGSVRVLRVDGRLPGAEGYPLTGTTP